MLFFSWLAGQLGADQRFWRRLVEQAYAYMPVTMVSLVIGLGDGLFQALPLIGIPASLIPMLKLSLFALGLVWSLFLGHRLLGTQGLAGARRLAALAPLLAGVGLVGLAWWPAIFGL